MTTGKPTLRSIPLQEIIVDNDLWPRDRLDKERVELFAEMYSEVRAQAECDRTGWIDPLPPLVSVADGRGQTILADGRHRLAALKRAGINAANVEEHVVDGRNPRDRAYELALLYVTLSAKPLTEREKQRAIVRTISERPDLSDRAIGRLIGVSHRTVGRWHGNVGNFPSSEGPDAAGRSKRTPFQRLASQLATAGKTIVKIDNEYTDYLPIVLDELTEIPGSGPESMRRLASFLEDLLADAGA